MAELLTDEIIIEKLNEDGIMQEPDGPWLIEYIYENYGGQLDTIIDTLETTLTAIETDQAAIEVLLTAANVDHAANEALLITIDSDTSAIKTAVEILDNAISGSEMQVDIVASLPALRNRLTYS